MAARLKILPLLAIPLSALLLAANDARSQASEAVDIRAVGDSGFVAANGVFGEPPKQWLDKRLEGFKALRSADVNFLNLEGTVTRSCRKFLVKPFAFAISPEAVAAFARAGFNLVSLANNHTLDCSDPPPTAEVTRALAEALKDFPDVKWHGLAPSAEALKKPALLKIKGLTLGMVSIKGWEAGRRAAVGNTSNRKILFEALRDAKADLRILSLHGGVENARRPTTEIMQVAREFVGEYGGDIVFAHHPHKTQGFEILAKKDGRRAVIFYSLGNFLHNGLSENGDGLMARVLATAKGIDVDSIGAYPLSNESTGPVTAVPSTLKEMLPILQASSVAISRMALPAGLNRIPFSLVSTSLPVPGYKLDVASAAKGPTP